MHNLTARGNSYSRCILKRIGTMASDFLVGNRSRRIVHPLGDSMTVTKPRGIHFASTIRGIRAMSCDGSRESRPKSHWSFAKDQGSLVMLVLRVKTRGAGTRRMGPCAVVV